MPIVELHAPANHGAHGGCTWSQATALRRLGSAVPPSICAMSGATAGDHLWVATHMAPVTRCHGEAAPRAAVVFRHRLR